MGKFDKEIAHWRERRDITLTDIKDFESGKREMGENDGYGWNDTTDDWIATLKIDVVQVDRLIEAYEALNA